MNADTLTRPTGSFSKDDARPGMAFFQGTGPQDKCCGDCKHRGYYREAVSGSHYRVQKCAVFKSMAGRHGHDIDRNWRSCKYFEQKPKD